MLNITSKHVIVAILSVLIVFKASGQKVLSMKEAEQIALANYPSIKAKVSQLNATRANLSESKAEYLPNLSLANIPL